MARLAYRHTAVTFSRNMQSDGGFECQMEQWLSNLSPIETYLIAVPAVMLGSVLLVGGIVLLFEPRTMSDAEKLAAIKEGVRTCR